MLLVFGTHGSPGASTTAILTGALWTASGRKVALLDCDPTGGTLAAHMGLLSDPGVVSLVLSPNITVDAVTSCSQKVLVENLHVLPLPSSVAGSASAVQRLSERGEELAHVSEEMPVIVDAGRVYYGTPMARLVPYAKAVVFVLQGVHLPALASMAHYRQMLGIDTESMETEAESLVAEFPLAESPEVQMSGVQMPEVQTPGVQAPGVQMSGVQPGAETHGTSSAATGNISRNLSVMLQGSLGVITIGEPYFSAEEYTEQMDLPILTSMPYAPKLAYDYMDTLRGQRKRARKFLKSTKVVSDILWQMTYGAPIAAPWL